LNFYDIILINNRDLARQFLHLREIRDAIEPPHQEKNPLASACFERILFVVDDGCVCFDSYFPSRIPDKDRNRRLNIRAFHSTCSKLFPAIFTESYGFLYKAKSEEGFSSAEAFEFKPRTGTQDLCSSSSSTHRSLSPYALLKFHSQ
jgi:hypothetical protein